VLTKYQILSFLESNKSYFLSDFSVSKIGIFGSYSSGKQNENSDLDLIVEFKPGTENLYETKRKMREYIESNLNIKVDICREKYIKSIFKEKILSDATYI
jgi:predicted nucleotidyltransferase